MPGTAVGSDPDGLRDQLPGMVLDTLEPPQVRRRHRQRAVVEERTHRLDRLPGISPELCCTVAEDVETGRLKPRSHEIAAKARG